MTGESGVHRPDAAARLRQATTVDLEALVEIEQRCFPDDAWTSAALARELAEPHALLLLLALAAGEPGAAGYVSLRRVGDDGELLRIAVLPGRRRRGLGRRLLAAGLDALRARGARRCSLEVRADNHAALALYEASGLRVVHRRRGYYRDRGDALVLAVDLAPAGVVPQTHRPP